MHLKSLGLVLVICSLIQLGDSWKWRSVLSKFEHHEAPLTLDSSKPPNAVSRFLSDCIAAGIEKLSCYHLEWEYEDESELTEPAESDGDSQPPKSSKTRNPIKKIQKFARKQIRENIPKPKFYVMEPSLRTESLPHVGLRNQGATCYMNSFLQTLFFIRPIRQATLAIQKQNDVQAPRILNALATVFHDLESSPTSVRTAPLTTAFNWSFRKLWRQQDMQEFSKLFLERIDADFQAVGHPDLIEDIFGGKLISRVKCLDVETESSRLDPFRDIQVSIEGSFNLHQALRKFMAEEKLTGENQFRTDEFGLQDAVKSYKFHTLPKVLSFQLQRVVYDVEKDRNVKLTDYFAYPTSINMCEFTENCESAEVYHLFGVVSHTGSFDSGHYRTFVRPNIEGQWYKFDDSVVTESDIHDVYHGNYGGYRFGPTAYVLYYVRESDIDTILGSKAE